MFGFGDSRLKSRVLLHFHAQLPSQLRILPFGAERMVLPTVLVRRDLRIEDFGSAIHNSFPGIVDSDLGIVDFHMEIMNSRVGIVNSWSGISSRKVGIHNSEVNTGDSESQRVNSQRARINSKRFPETAGLYRHNSKLQRKDHGVGSANSSKLFFENRARLPGQRNKKHKQIKPTT